MRILSLAATTLIVILIGCGASDQGPRASPSSESASVSETPASETASATESTTESATESATEGAMTDAPTTEAPTTGTPGVGAAGGGCDSVEAGVIRFTTEAGGVPVEVRVLVPPAFDGVPLPAVIDWHGLGSNGQQQLALTGYATLAATEGFVAVHPTGAPAPGSPQRSWELAQFDVPGRDDLTMADDIIDRLVADHCVDPNRVYSTGMSNGGFFTARLVCERADRIAAAVSVAGVTHPAGCRPTRPVPYLAFHGTADEIVPFDGGDSALEVGSSDATTEAFFDQVMPDELAEFAADFGCRPEPTTVTIGDEVVRHDYQGCDGAVPVSFYEIDGGGHTWPASPLAPVLGPALGHTTDQVDATAEGWSFMSRHSLP